MPVPHNIKVYHIVHEDRLSSIVRDDAVLCDRTISERQTTELMIGMSTIKERRLTLPLRSHQGLHVGDCVPFYFCPRSVMLYVIYKRNHPDLAYHGGQVPILHLEADLQRVVSWANENGRRWAFTNSNAGSFYFEDFCDLKELERLDWRSIHANNWQERQEYKQAEFLLEASLPWELIDQIGTSTGEVRRRVAALLSNAQHKPQVCVTPNWYY